jgi:hypothetical protein
MMPAHLPPIFVATSCKKQISEGKFLQNLIYHGSQLETINEAVGLAQVTGRGSMLSSALAERSN